MATIPHEILHQIFLGLPVKSIIKFKCISKEWKQHFDSVDFIQQHHNRTLQCDSHSSNHSLLILTQDSSSIYIIHDPSNPCRPIEFKLPLSFKNNIGTLKIIGSSNGFVCVASGRGLNHYALFNPYIPASVKVLPYARNKLSELRHAYDYPPRPNLFSGFGFDCHNNDYKIVYGVYRRNYWPEVVVFSLILGSWKSLKSLPDVRHVNRISDGGVVLNNCLHWCCSWDKSQKVFSFDLDDEEWSEITLPDLQKGYFVKDVVVFKGCLSVLSCSDWFSDTNPELWVMKDYGVVESWTKVFTLPIDQSGYVIYSSLRCQVMLQNSRGLYWYDVHNEKIVDKVSTEGDIAYKASKVVSFVGTLVSLNRLVSRTAKLED